MLKTQMHLATLRSVEQAANIVQMYSRQEAPKGVEGNTTNPPGDLAASIVIDGPHTYGDIVVAEVGPTVIYGRQRELGGDIYPTNKPELVFTKWGKVYHSLHVYQHPNPYMARALVISHPMIEAAVDKEVALAIKAV